MAHDVFISYSTPDKLAAYALCAALEAARIRCWIAPRDVLAGVSYGGEITRAINVSKVMVLIFSEHARSSTAVLSEVELAARARVHIVNFRVDASPVGADLEYYLQHRHWLDALTPPVEQHHAKLVVSVQKLLQLGEDGLDTEISFSAPVSEEAPSLLKPPARSPNRLMILVLLGIVVAGVFLAWHFSRLSAPASAQSSSPNVPPAQASPAPGLTPNLSQPTPYKSVADQRLIPNQLDPAFNNTREKFFTTWDTDAELEKHFWTVSAVDIPIYKEFNRENLGRDLFIPNLGVKDYVVRGNMSETDFWKFQSGYEMIGEELVSVSMHLKDDGEAAYWALWIPKAAAKLLVTKMRELGMTQAKVEKFSTLSSPRPSANP